MIGIRMGTQFEDFFEDRRTFDTNLRPNVNVYLESDRTAMNLEGGQTSVEGGRAQTSCPNFHYTISVNFAFVSGSTTT